MGIIEVDSEDDFVSIMFEPLDELGRIVDELLSRIWVWDLSPKEALMLLVPCCCESTVVWLRAGLISRHYK